MYGYISNSLLRTFLMRICYSRQGMYMYMYTIISPPIEYAEAEKEMLRVPEQF